MKLKQVGSNMTELHLGETKVLFSYETPVAAHVNGCFVRTEEKFSATTTRHINKWLNGADAKTVSQSFIEGLLK